MNDDIKNFSAGVFVGVAVLVGLIIYNEATRPPEASVTISWCNSENVCQLSTGERMKPEIIFEERVDAWDNYSRPEGWTKDEEK